MIAVCVAVSNYTKVHKKFIEVDNTPVSQIEFDFYYGVAKSDLLNSQGTAEGKFYGENAKELGGLAKANDNSWGAAFAAKK